MWVTIFIYVSSLSYSIKLADFFSEALLCHVQRRLLKSLLKLYISFILLSFLP